MLLVRLFSFTAEDVFLIVWIPFSIVTVMPPSTFLRLLSIFECAAITCVEILNGKYGHWVSRVCYGSIATSGTDRHYQKDPNDWSSHQRTYGLWFQCKGIEIELQVVFVWYVHVNLCKRTLQVLRYSTKIAPGVPQASANKLEEGLPFESSCC